MLITLLGRVMLVKPLQYANAPFPILIRLFGRVMLVKPVQLSNPASAILVTLPVRVTLVITAHSSNAAIPMLVTLAGVVNAPAFPQGYCISAVLSLLYSTPPRCCNWGYRGELLSRYY